MCELKILKSLKQNGWPMLWVPALAISLAGCMHDAQDQPNENGVESTTLFVGGQSKIAAYDLKTGEQKSGEITDVASLTDMTSLEDGTVLVNNGAKNQILIFDGKTMLEKNRITSKTGLLKPTHGFVSTPLAGKQYFASLWDGNGTKVTNGVVFVDVQSSSDTYLQHVGEAPLGLGHHKAAMSRSKFRSAISNISDCGALVKVLDFSDMSQVTEVAQFSATELGFDGSSPEKTCGAGGVSLSPHGAATAAITGRAYHNLTGIGKILSIDQDAALPTAKLLATQGKGGGYSKSLAGTDYVYSLQNFPREGSATHPGSACQIGQIAVIDGQLDSVIREIPILLTGPNCTDSLPSVSKNAGLDHMTLVPSENRLFVLGGNSDTAGYSWHRYVFDISNPELPKQLPSIAVGKSRGHHPETLSGDGKWLVEGDNLDNTVTVIDVKSGKVVQTIPVISVPTALTTWSAGAGPSHPTGPVE